MGNSVSMSWCVVYFWHSYHFNAISSRITNKQAIWRGMIVLCNHIILYGFCILNNIVNGKHNNNYLKIKWRKKRNREKFQQYIKCAYNSTIIGIEVARVPIHCSQHAHKLWNIYVSMKSIYKYI